MEKSPAMKRWLKRIAVLGAAGLLGGIAFALYVGQQLVAPAHRAIGDPPADFPAEEVRFSSGSGSSIVGWLSEKPDAGGAILLLHGVRADRRSMVGRARFLGQRGYHTLCLDLQAHGESGGTHITMGHLESMDASAGVAYLHKRYPGLPVAVVGSSLGGAAALLAKYDDPPRAFVVESVFADVETAIGNRLTMRFGALGRLFTPLLSWQLRPRLGIQVDTLSPVHAIAGVRQPVLVIYGSEDRHARPGEAKALYAAAAGPKEIWEVGGAAHVDLYRYNRAGYENRVGEFLANYLNAGQATAQPESKPK